jgi:hypothetical protein
MAINEVGVEGGGEFHDQGNNVKKQDCYQTPGAKQLRRNQFSK